MGARRKPDCAPERATDQAADRAATNQRANPTDGYATDEGAIADDGADSRTYEDAAANIAAHEDFAANVITNKNTIANISGYSHSDGCSNRINNNWCSDHHAIQSK